jgi:hypothetical protein
MTSLFGGLAFGLVIYFGTYLLYSLVATPAKPEASFAAAALPVRASIAWQTDYAAAKAQAAKEGKRLLVVVGSAQCTWCVRQDQTTFRDPAVVKLAGELIPAKVDGNADAGLRQKLGVLVYPTTLVIAADGTVLARHEGYAGPRQMIGLIKTK